MCALIDILFIKALIYRDEIITRNL